MQRTVAFVVDAEAVVLEGRNRRDAIATTGFGLSRFLGKSLSLVGTMIIHPSSKVMFIGF